MPAKKCHGWFSKDDVMAEERTVEGIVRAAADFPDTASGDGPDRQSAVETAENEARRKADEWCRKRSCNTGDCHQDGFHYKIIADHVSETSQDAAHPGLKIFFVIIQITEVRCVCKNVNPVIVRPTGSKDYERIFLKERLADRGLSKKQIERIAASKCGVRLGTQLVVVGWVPKSVTVAVCEVGLDQKCDPGAKCKLVLYKIGDDTDKGTPKDTPYDLKNLPQGYYFACECR
jgi:hypothetical protein